MSALLPEAPERRTITCMGRASDNNRAHTDDGDPTIALESALEAVAQHLAALIARHLAPLLTDQSAARAEVRGIPKLLDAKTAASHLGMSTKTLYRRVKDGRITCVVEDGGGKRFRPSDLEAYVEKRVKSLERAGRLARTAK